MQTIFKDNLFNDKIALVTGGGTGIGLRITRELIKLGAIVIIASRKLEILKQAKLSIENEFQLSNKLDIFECNIRKQDSVINCIDYIITKYNKID